jgi:hypothetical protein
MTVSPQRAAEVLARFRQQKPEAVRLAELVCLATRIEHGLLREARLRLAPDTDAGAEADLWFSPLTESWSARAFVLSSSVAAILQAELLKDRERAQRAWALTERLHSNVPPIIAVEERVTWLALSQGAKALPEMERELQAVLRTMLHDERQGPGVARWALRAIPRLPTLARETGTARLLAFGAAARLGIRTLADGAVSLPPQDASWLLPQSSSEPLLEIRVVRTAAGLTFFHGRTTAEGHPLLVPNTRPLLLEVAWVQEGQEQHRLIEAKIGATLPIPADVRTIRLRTVAGDEYELSVESSSNAPPLPRYLDDTAWQSLAWIPGRPQPTTAYFIDSSALLTAATAFLDEPAETPVEIVWNEKRFTATLLHTDVRAGYALLELPEGSPRANPLAGTILKSTEESALDHKRDWVAYGLLEGERLWIEGYLDEVLLSVEEEVYATRASMPFDRLPIGSPIFMNGLFLVGHVDWWEGQTIHFGTASGVHETLSELREARARRRPTSSNVPPAEISQEASPPAEEELSQKASPPVSAQGPSITEPTSPSVISDPALTELREIYDSGDLVLFAGPGTSSAAGLPGWKKLVEFAIAHARRRDDPPPRIAEMEELASRGEFDDALSVAYQLFGGSEFGTFVERHLNDEKHDLPPALQAISKLGTKLRAALTSNLDHFLERALHWPVLWKPQADLVRRRRFIYKFHGTLLDRPSWVFTRSQYDRVIWADPLFRTTFSALFMACPLFFVGFGLADDSLESLFSQVRALSGDQPPLHFALIPKGALKGFRRDRITQAGVRLIEYPNLDGKHTDVALILEWLAEGDPHRFPETAPA